MENINDETHGKTSVSRVPTVTGNPPEIQMVPESQDCTSIKTNLYILGKALNPIDLDEWPEQSLINKCYQVIKCPVEVLFRLTIPVVDEDKPRNNWCQYLAIIHCVLGKTIIGINWNHDSPHCRARVFYVCHCRGQ